MDSGSEVWCFALNRAGGGKPPSNMGPLHWWALDPSLHAGQLRRTLHRKLDNGHDGCEGGKERGKENEENFSEDDARKAVIQAVCCD